MGVSRAVVAERAIEEACAAARAGLGVDPVFAIVCATGDLFVDADGFSRGLRATFGALPHVGSSTSLLGVGVESWDARALAVLLVGGAVDARTFALGRAPGLPTLDEAIADLGGPVAGIVAFVDPRSPAVPVLPRMVRELALGVPLVGGGSTSKGQALVQVCDRQVLEGTAVGLVVTLPAASTGVLVAQSGELVGRRGVVTKSEGGTILEVDGEPATQVLLEPLRTAELPAKAEDLATHLAIAIAPGGSAALESGDFVVRNLAGVDAQKRAVLVAARVEEGQAVSLVLREAIAARTRVSGGARMLGRSLGARPVGGIYFDCASRGEALYGADGVDAASIRRELGEFPLLSMRSAFELGPLRVGDEARPELHLFSGVLWVLAGAEASPVSAAS